MNIALNISFKGDSGGPLEVEEDGKWILAGIVSYGGGICGKYELLDIFGESDIYSRWCDGSL